MVIPKQEDNKMWLYVSWWPSVCYSLNYFTFFYSPNKTNRKMLLN